VEFYSSRWLSGSLQSYPDKDSEGQWLANLLCTSQFHLSWELLFFATWRIVFSSLIAILEKHFCHFQSFKFQINQSIPVSVLPKKRGQEPYQQTCSKNKKLVFNNFQVCLFGSLNWSFLVPIVSCSVAVRPNSTEVMQVIMMLQHCLRVDMNHQWQIKINFVLGSIDEVNGVRHKLKRPINPIWVLYSMPNIQSS
jgi:hypothetical protein